MIARGPPTGAKEFPAFGRQWQDGSAGFLASDGPDTWASLLWGRRHDGHLQRLLLLDLVRQRLADGLVLALALVAALVGRVEQLQGDGVGADLGRRQRHARLGAGLRRGDRLAVLLEAELQAIA